MLVCLFCLFVVGGGIFYLCVCVCVCVCVLLLLLLFLIMLNVVDCFLLLF